MTDKPEFGVADKAITCAAAKIEQVMIELLQTTLPLSHVVATDYVVERLAHELQSATRWRSTGSTVSAAKAR